MKGRKTGGRQPGTPNKKTAQFNLAALRKVYKEIGGDRALTRWAKENPGEFFKMCAKLIPNPSVLIATAGDVNVTETDMTDMEAGRRMAFILTRGEAQVNEQSLIVEQTPAERRSELAAEVKSIDHGIDVNDCEGALPEHIFEQCAFDDKIREEARMSAEIQEELRRPDQRPREYFSNRRPLVVMGRKNRPH